MAEARYQELSTDDRRDDVVTGSATHGQPLVRHRDALPEIREGPTVSGCPASLSSGAQTLCTVTVHTDKCSASRWNRRSLCIGIGDHFGSGYADSQPTAAGLDAYERHARSRWLPRPWCRTMTTRPGNRLARPRLRLLPGADRGALHLEGHGMRRNGVHDANAAGRARGPWPVVLQTRLTLHRRPPPCGAARIDRPARTEEARRRYARRGAWCARGA